MIRRFVVVSMRFVVITVCFALLRPTPAGQQVQAWLKDADRLAQAGKYDEAIALYDRILIQTEPRASLYEKLVQWSVDARQYAEARIYLYALVNLDGWDTIRRTQLEYILERSGETAQASALLYASLEQETNPRALQALAEQQIDLAAWYTAQQTLERWLAAEPGNAEASYQLGLLLAPLDQVTASTYLAQAMEDQTWVMQAQAVRQALAVYETEALTDAHTYLGTTLVRLGEWVFAQHAFQLALAANSVNSVAMAYLGFVLDQRGGNGLDDIEAALAMDPSNPMLYYFLGLHWRLHHDHKAAYDAFEQAYFFSPDNPALAAEIGVSLQALEDLAAAEEWLRVAVDLDPANPAWRRLLAAFYADTGFLIKEVGMTFIQESSQLMPNDADLLTSLGWGYYQTENYEPAFEALNRAVSIDSSNPRIRYYFGMMLEQRGDSASAADSYWYVVNQAGMDEGFGLLATRALQRLGYAIG